MSAHNVVRRLLAGALAILLVRTAAALPNPPAPAWGSDFASMGFVFDQFLDGPTCLFSHQTPDGPRLFVGGEFTGVHTPSATSTLPYKGVAIWNGAHWSSIQGGGVFTGFGDGSLQAITSIPIAGVSRVALAGFFAAPGTGVGIGYLDDALALHAMAPGPVPSAWFGGAFGWMPPSAPPPAQPSTPEIIVTSGIFPNGSDYAYRYTPAGVALLPPGLVTVTTAFAVFDDGLGGGPALYIGVPMSGSGPAFMVTRWNGATLTPMNPGPMTWINALCVHDDGSGGGPALYAAGQGFRRYRAGAWEAVTGVGAPNFNINALASFDDGSGPALYAAGQFTTNVVAPTGTAAAVNIARLRNGVWEALGTGLVGGPVKALGVYDEDGPGPRPAGLFAVGKFTTAGGRSSVGIARWGVPICRADYNGANGLTIQDIFDFLSDWFVSSPRADFDGVSGVGTQDIFDFLAAWFSGC